ESAQVRKINMVGDNLYPQKFYGEMVLQDGWRMVQPNFISIAVSNDGIISVLEEKSKQIYQYTQDGTMLNVFGGDGEVAGFFKSPVSIVVDSKGSVLVADTSNNTVQRFTRTSFAASIYEAQVAYDNGMYEEAYELFLKAKKVNPNYSILNNGMAECLYKMERYDEAAELYKFADNREGYGKVQAIKRKVFIKEHFGWVCFAILVVVVILIFVVYKLKKYVGLLVRRFYHLDD
ncbi:MAG: tetratricopeptide repeat protein, partial [Clostridia bacterium]|nr:tetratricopeptide repeat protein [Clostridia bacterium]